MQIYIMLISLIKRVQRPVPFYFIPHHKHFLTLVGVKKIQQKEKIVIKFVKQLQLSK